VGEKAMKPDLLVVAAVTTCDQIFISTIKLVHMAVPVHGSGSLSETEEEDLMSTELRP
jgi:hypothetical protein